MATVSGQAGDCIQNPRLAYGQYTEPRPRKGQRVPSDQGWSNDNWNGWNRHW